MLFMKYSFFSFLLFICSVYCKFFYPTVGNEGSFICYFISSPSLSLSLYKCRLFKHYFPAEQNSTGNKSKRKLSAPHSHYGPVVLTGSSGRCHNGFLPQWFSPLCYLFIVSLNVLSFVVSFIARISQLFSQVLSVHYLSVWLSRILNGSHECC